MTEWFVELEASERDVHFLVSSFGSSDVSIFQEAGSIFLRAPKLLSEISSAEAFELATELLETTNGAAKVLNPTYNGASLKAIGFRDEQNEIKRHYILHAQAGRYILHAGGINEPTISELVQLTTNSQSVTRALTIYGALEHNWKNLFMVMEVIEEDLGGESSVLKSYPEITQKWKLCKHTANSFAAIGREARHAKNFEAPSDIMQIEEAQELVRQVLFHWLRIKVQNGVRNSS